MDFKDFELSIIRTMLSENADRHNRLLDQVDSAVVVSRQFTGHGFFTHYDVDDKSLTLPNNEDMQLSCLGQLEGVENGVGFVLFIREGLIRTLEGFTYDELWPDSIGNFTLGM